MKKIISMVLAVLMLASCAVAFASCKKDDAGKDDKKGAKVIDIALSEELYAFGVDKNQPELKDKVNAYLAQIKEDGTFDEICNKYFGNGTPAEIISAEEDPSKDQLIVATSTGFEPFEMVDNGVYSGIDLEIAKGIADYLGKELVIKDMEFKSVVTSVQTGKCDIAMAGLTITEERKEQVDFSDSYYSANQVLVVKASNTEFDGCTTKEDVDKILNAKDSNTKIGCQTGTTGELYIDGDEGYGFAKLPVTKMGYDYAALAVTAMLNGQIDYVIVDNAPAAAIVKAINAVQ